MKHSFFRGENVPKRILGPSLLMPFTVLFCAIKARQKQTNLLKVTKHLHERNISKLTIDWRLRTHQDTPHCSATYKSWQWPQRWLAGPLLLARTMAGEYEISNFEASEFMAPEYWRHGYILCPLSSFLGFQVSSLRFPFYTGEEIIDNFSKTFTLWLTGVS